MQRNIPAFVRPLFFLIYCFSDFFSENKLRVGGRKKKELHLTHSCPFTYIHVSFLCCAILNTYNICTNLIEPLDEKHLISFYHDYHNYSFPFKSLFSLCVSRSICSVFEWDVKRCITMLRLYLDTLKLVTVGLFKCVKYTLWHRIAEGIEKNHIKYCV